MFFKHIANYKIWRVCEFPTPEGLQRQRQQQHPISWSHRQTQIATHSYFLLPGGGGNLPYKKCNTHLCSYYTNVLEKENMTLARRNIHVLLKHLIMIQPDVVWIVTLQLSFHKIFYSTFPISCIYDSVFCKIVNISCWKFSFLKNVNHFDNFI